MSQQEVAGPLRRPRQVALLKERVARMSVAHFQPHPFLSLPATLHVEGAIPVRLCGAFATKLEPLTQLVPGLRVLAALVAFPYRWAPQVLPSVL